MVTTDAPIDERALLKRITVRPDVFGGKPIIRDMRISVDSIISLMVQGETEAAILTDFPELEPEDIRAALAYARHLPCGHNQTHRGLSSAITLD
jgi:uncharacterized protein (DUF433 family)